jgi:seryl-tRNA synthetase
MSSTSLSIIPDLEIPEFLTKEIGAKLAYVDDTIFDAKVSADLDGIVLHLTEEPSKARREYLIEKTNLVVSSLVKGAFEPHLRVVVDKTGRDFSYGEDPMDTLARMREVVIEGHGYYTLGPMMSGLLEYFEEQYLAVAVEMGARPYRFPALISPAYLEKVKYFSNFPHSLSFVTHLREDLDVIKEFSEDARTLDGRIKAKDDAFADVQAMLSPTVCHHLYMSLADSVVPAEGVIATATGNCFRYESSNMASLERLWNFTMREIIFVGTESFVKDGLDRAQERMNVILDEMDLAYRIETANDPFFIGSYRDQAAYQNAFELKLEVRLPLPYSGETLAAASYNRHRDFFGRTLGIRMPDGSFSETGCVGFGCERLAFAFVAQHGPNQVNWPQAVREHVENAEARWHSPARPTFDGPPNF